MNMQTRRVAEQKTRIFPFASSSRWFLFSCDDYFFLDWNFRGLLCAQARIPVEDSCAQLRIADIFARVSINASSCSLVPHSQFISLLG
jgi:hypothetical protein